LTQRCLVAREDVHRVPLLTARALKDVHATRLADLAAKIAAQEKSVIAAGRVARTQATEVAHQLSGHRLDVALTLVNETFDHQPLGNPEHLARHDKRYIAADKLAGGLTAYVDELNEIRSLRQLRAAFAPVVESVNNEQGLHLNFPEAWFTK
jgi:hypothetical protein